MAQRRLGISWSLDQNVATFFAHRGTPSHVGFLYAAEVEHGDVLAYFTGRSEAEVIVDPATLKKIRRVGHPALREAA